MKGLVLAIAALAVSAQPGAHRVAKRFNEVIHRNPDEETHLCGRGGCTAIPSKKKEDLPDAWEWGDVDGVNYLTKSLNQHLPQYCGSCWAHGALSALADRIKIDRGAEGVDINLSVQHVLNCGTAGSCHGGNQLSVYEWIMNNGGVSYDTANPYLACSSESREGFCSKIDTTCTPMNVARNCETFGVDCTALEYYPNATVAEAGMISGDADDIAAEVMARGPVACGVDANGITDYEGGIVDDTSRWSVDHIVSIVGFGTSEDGTPYWTVRNSWGEYWGEMGFFRIKRGENQLGIESMCAWAVPGDYTLQNYPCHEDGGNCVASSSASAASSIKKTTDRIRRAGPPGPATRRGAPFRQH